MFELPDPVWPVLVLAIVSFGDGVMCIKPMAFIARCFDDVGWPRRLWWLMPPIKFAAAAGLVAGIWVPYLGAITTAAVVLYFIVAIAMHIRARDFGRNLFLNATGMLLLSLFVLVRSFVW
jgi:hypothetical protein